MWLDNTILSMKTILITMSAIAIFMFSSCIESNDSETCDYSNCNTIYPSEGVMKVKVSEEYIQEGVPISIYDGYFDNGTLLKRDTLYTSEKKYYLSPEMYYSVAAEYHRNGETVYAIDGGRISIRSNKICDSVCYSVQDLTINVKLK